MASIGASDDFALDDDGILRDSMSGMDGLLIDEHGIVRDDDLDLYKHIARGHWTDSGIGGDKQSSTSTLQHLQNSFEEDLAPIGDESVNISEFEASKDELSEDDFGGSGLQNKVADSLDLGRTMDSTLDKPNDQQSLAKSNRKSQRTDSQNAADFDKLADDFDNQQLFTPEYYQQLRDLGVLVDGADLSRDSLNEFEELESRVASRAEGEHGGGQEDDDQRDLIGEYLKHEYIKERMENEESEREAEEVRAREEQASRRKKMRRNNAEMEGRSEDEGFSRPSSGHTMSSRSFPDDEDDDDYDKGDHSQNLGSQGGSQSQRTVGDDDEIFYINSNTQSQLERHRHHQQQQQQQRQQRRLPGGPLFGSRGASPGLGSERRLSIDDDNRSIYSDAMHRSRPSSVASHISTASENVSARQKRAELAATQRMSKAKSQESFFEGELTPKSGEKSHHKRILPQPSSSGGVGVGGGASSEANQSFRLKSKSVTNIAAKSGPLKPAHASLSEITRLHNLDDSGGGGAGGGPNEDSTENAGDESTGELTSRFTQEAQKRKQATELVQQLQKDYNSLLTKYALAELTIDQMRLGAKITIHADSPTPAQSQPGVVSPAVGQQPQLVQLRSSPSQGLMRSSPGQGMLGHTSPLVGVATGTVDSGDQTTDGRTSGLDAKLTSRSDYSQASTTGSQRPSIADSEDGSKDEVNSEPAKVKVDMATHARALDERLESFHGMMEQRQLTLEQQEQAFEDIRSAHDTLRRSYLQAKEDYNVLRRSGALTGEEQHFDSNKELEGQLFRLGMRFDEVQEKVEGNLKEKSQRRQPFQAEGKKSDGKHTGDHNDKDTSYDDRGSARSDTSDRHRLMNGSRTNSLDSTDGGMTDRRIHELREEYNANMDSYRKLKYATDTPEGKRDVDTITKRLHDICTEMPDMFRLSPEIQSRWDSLKMADKLKLVDRKSSVWEKLNQREQDKRSQRQSPVPNSGRMRGQDRQSPNLSRQMSDSSDIDSLRARLDGSRSSLGSILPDRMDRPPSRSGSHYDRPSSRSGNRIDRPSSRNSNRGHDPNDSNQPSSRTQDRNSPNPSLPRPRRHEQRGVRDPKLSSMPDMGSMHSLPDSGISDQENSGPSQRRRRSQDHNHNGAPAANGQNSSITDGALASLPSSKFKQMTKQRAADDADSGFIGSVVGSGVGLPISRQQQEQQQREETVRLRRNVADESSTITDQSMDTSTQQVKKPSSSRSRDGRGERSRSHRSQGTGRSSVENSYDAGEDTMETLESDMSMQREGGRLKQRHGGARPKIKRKEDQRDVSLDATLEGDLSQESDVSTPRAANQKSPQSRESTRQDARQVPSTPKKSAMRASPVPDKRPSSRQQTTSEEEEELKKAIAKERARQLRSKSLQTLDKEDTTLKKRLKSPPPPVRPSSRGSPTTDLYHTREKKPSGDSVRSRRSSQREEITRQEHTETLQPRAELRLDLVGNQVERPNSRQGRRSRSDQDNPLLPDEDDRYSEIARRVKEYEERSVGSDVEVGSSVTRASSTNSNRLRALQEEIERLKEGVAKANEKSSHPPPQPPVFQAPPQLPPDQNQRDGPDFYDPFDDPYGFMRMPRRRANSFSGGREREWDEWYWTLPQNRQYTGADIPLGYAAADAYADLPPSAATGVDQERNSRENVRNRLRQRRMDKRSRAEVEQNPQTAGAEVDPGIAVGVPPVMGDPAQLNSAPMAQRPGLSDEQTAAMYNYYVPSRYSTQGMRNQMASRGFFTTPSGAKIYTRTGEDGEVDEEEAFGRRVIIGGTGYQQGPRTATANSPWYQIRRNPQPFSFGPQGAQSNNGPGGRRAQSHEDISYRVQSQSAYYGNQQQQPQPTTYGTQTFTSACPMCGGSSYHTHANYVHAGQPASIPPPNNYGNQDVRSRPRSRSASRSRHYSPERSRARSNSRTRYHVREYSHLSNSDEERSRPRRRSRSESRGRTKLKSPPRSSHNSRKYKRQVENSYSDGSDDHEGLDRSLSLSMDISKLTKKMLGALSTELKRSKDKREFGSSYW